MMNNHLYLPAEWAEQDAIAIIWPHAGTDWAYMLDDVTICFQDIVNTITSFGERVVIIANNADDKSIPSGNELITIVECPTNDTWARDCCAITTLNGSSTIINDFKFNGWGLKFAADKDNLITSRLNNAGFFNGEYNNLLNFVIEGGSIESDGNGSLLTTSECLLSKNRNGQSSQAEIEAKLKEMFGVSRVLWLNHGYLSGDDTDSHIDTLARFAPHNTILYVSTENEKDEHFKELKAMENELRNLITSNGCKYILKPLPLPDPIFDENGERLPATYANFLIGNGFVLVPTYGQEKNDKIAIDIIASAFPDREIANVDCRTLIRQHGSLHCVTMQFPKNSLNI